MYLQVIKSESKADLRLVVIKGMVSFQGVRMLPAKLLQWWLFANRQTEDHQTPLSMGVFRQDYWSGLPCPPPGDLAHPGIETTPLISPELAGGFFTINATCEAHACLGSGHSYLTLSSGTHIVLISFGSCNPLQFSLVEFMTLFLSPSGLLLFLPGSHCILRLFLISFSR